MPLDKENGRLSRRTPVSCHFCRSRKLRCSREFPCENCSTRGINCQLEVCQPSESSGKKRKLDPSEKDDPRVLARLRRLEDIVLGKSHAASTSTSSETAIIRDVSLLQTQANYKQEDRTRTTDAERLEREWFNQTWLVSSWIRTNRTSLKITNT